MTKGHGIIRPAIKEDRLPETNSSKRLPIVFCLDISPSMRWKEEGEDSAIDLLNEAVRRFIAELNSHPKARGAAEVSFITFSTNIVSRIGFTQIKNLNIPVFTTVERGGTNMAEAVVEAINDLDIKRNQLKNSDISYYASFLVIVTDGNPDDNDDKSLQAKALSLVEQHCHRGIKLSEMIIPFVIGVGSRINPDILNKYSSMFANGFFHIKGNGTEKARTFYEVFELIISSAFVSFNTNPQKAVEVIKTNINQLLEDLSGI